jgi:hypothetical protein
MKRCTASSCRLPYGCAGPNDGSDDVVDRLAGTDYEILVHGLIGRLSSAAGVATTRLEHDVRVQGRGANNQVDVLWDFTDAAGRDQRMIFEAKSYARAVDQGRLHTLRSVVDDIQDARRPVTGAMITTRGYQRGARSIAETYGLLVLELRVPESDDLRGRVSQITVKAVTQRPVITDVEFRAVEIYDSSANGTEHAIWRMTLVPRGGDLGAGQPLHVNLAAGELGPLGQPRSAHRVVRTFDPPLELWIDDTRTALLHGIEATVGETIDQAATFRVGGLDSLAYMVRNALTDARVWFATNGRIWETD